MAFPKGFRKNIKLIKDKVGFDKRQEILDDIDSQGTFLPRGVMYEDMDKSFVDFIEEDMKIVIDGEEVPVIFLTIQRWSEFSKTWQHSDKYKNIQMPFITIVRRPNPQVGNNQAGLFNIPGRRTYTYMKVPTFEGGRKGVDVYKIPQPTSVDITYDVRIFCNKMRDLNKFNIKIQQEFNAIQRYIRVNGHPMPLLLESIGDESNIDDFENRRFYVQPYEIRLEGYILDEDQFEVIPAVNRALVMAEVSEGRIIPEFNYIVDEKVGEVLYDFTFKPNARLELGFKVNANIMFDEILDVTNLTNILIRVNGVDKFNGLNFTNPLYLKTNDHIYIKVTRANNSTASSFKLKGKHNIKQ